MDDLSTKDSEVVKPNIESKRLGMNPNDVLLNVRDVKTNQLVEAIHLNRKFTHAHLDGWVLRMTYPLQKGDRAMLQNNTFKKGMKGLY